MPPDQHRRMGSLRSSRDTPNNDDHVLEHYNFIRRVNDSWTTGQISIQELCTRQELVPSILVVFLPAVADLTDQVRDELSNRFNISTTFWSSVVQEASGFFGCHDTRDANEELKSFSSRFCFLIKEPTRSLYPGSNASNIGLSYLWQRLGFYTFWTPSKSLVTLCFDLPQTLVQSISTSLSGSGAQWQLCDPFSIHTLLIERVIECYDTSLWAWRDLIRELERNRTAQDDPQPDFITMHEIARHTIHSSETLAMAIETVESMIREQEIFFEENPSLSQGSTKLSKQTRRSLRSHITLLKCLHLRSKALEERLRNEINLAFSSVAQYDSRIGVRISKATQVDSAAMKTISVLGLVFLPGTFICALFSTSFFNFSPSSGTEPQRWTVSEKFWVYWAVAVPITLVTVVCWISWQQVYEKSSLHKRR